EGPALRRRHARAAAQPARQAAARRRRTAARERCRRRARVTLQSTIASALTLPLRLPVVTVLLVVLATVAAGIGWNSVAFEPDVSRLLPQDHPQVHVQELLDDRSRPARTLWLLVRGDDLRTAVPALAAALRKSPLVADVASTRDEVFGPAVARARAAPL